MLTFAASYRNDGTNWGKERHGEREWNQGKEQDLGRERDRATGYSNGRQQQGTATGDRDGWQQRETATGNNKVRRATAKGDGWQRRATATATGNWDGQLGRAIGTGNRDGHKDSRQQRAKASGKGRQRRAKGDSDGRQERATANGDGRQRRANRDGGQQRAMAMWSGDGHHLQLRAKQWAVATAAWTVMGGLYYRSPIFTYL